MGSGLAVLHYHDLRMNPEHPPLMKVLGMLPVYLFYCPDLRIDATPTHLNAWKNSTQEIWGYAVTYLSGREPLKLLAVARIIPILIGFCGGLLAFFMARALSMPPLACLFAALLLWFYPEYFGHARFLTLDIPTLFGCAAVSLTVLRWWQKPTTPRLAVAAITCGICSQIKLPVTLFIVLQVIVLLIMGRFQKSGTNGPMAITRGRSYAFCAAILGTIYIACWCSAGFRFASVPPNAAFDHLSPNLPPMHGHGLSKQIVNFPWKHHLLPETTLATIRNSFSFQGRQMFFLGEKSRTGWYSYFLVTYLLKTPLAFVAATIMVICLGLSRLTRAIRTHLITSQFNRKLLVYLPFVLMFLYFARSRPNIGHRQVLFIYFPLAIAVGGLAAGAWSKGGWRRVAAGALVLLQVGNTMYAFPNEETYFNELIRTPYRASGLVQDSNVDWGTDMPAVAAYLRKAGIEKVNLAMMGYNRPESYGLEHFNWIIPDYPYAAGMPAAVSPDPKLPSVISLFCLPLAREFYPETFEREPVKVLNSVLVFAPAE